MERGWRKNRGKEPGLERGWGEKRGKEPGTERGWGRRQGRNQGGSPGLSRTPALCLPLRPCLALESLGVFPARCSWRWLQHPANPTCPPVLQVGLAVLDPLLSSQERSWGRAGGAGLQVWEQEQQAGVKTGDNTAALASCSSETPGKTEFKTQTKHPQSSLSKGNKGSGPMKFTIDTELLGAAPSRLVL